MTTHGVAAYPLYWPLKHQRTKYRRSASFQVDFTAARTHLLEELRRLRAIDPLISSNIPIRRDGLPMVPDREPEDPGIAVYFTRYDSNGSTIKKPYVIACDSFTRVRWNLRAIGLTIASLRSIERHGSTALLEQAFSGFAALPSSTTSDWRRVLFGSAGLECTIDEVRERVRQLALVHHPDVGGSGERMAEINAAAADAVRELEGGSVGGG